MTTDAFRPCFAAIPMRACCDKRLYGLPMALLAIVAAHDRFGANGQGCYASQKRLAQLARCDEKYVSRVISDLVEWGYISVQQAPNDRRRRIYCVLYTSEDARAFGAEKGGPESTYRPEKGGAQSTYSAEKGGPEHTHSPSDDGDKSLSSKGNQPAGGSRIYSAKQDKYIPRSARNDDQRGRDSPGKRTEFVACSDPRWPQLAAAHQHKNGRPPPTTQRRETFELGWHFEREEVCDGV